MTDRNIFDAIITLPSDNSIMLLESLSIIRKYTPNIELLANDEGKIYYKVLINDLLEKDITEDDITKLKNASWKMNNEYLIKDM